MNKIALLIMMIVFIGNNGMSLACCCKADAAEQPKIKLKINDEINFLPVTHCSNDKKLAKACLNIITKKHGSDVFMMYFGLFSSEARLKSMSMDSDLEKFLGRGTNFLDKEILNDLIAQKLFINVRSIHPTIVCTGVMPA